MQKQQRRNDLVQIGMLAGIAVVLMLFDIPLPFAPSFYQIDLSELPVLIGAFAMGPMAGVLIELIKVLLNLVINGTDTAFVGEFANFLIGCALIVPAALVYQRISSDWNDPWYHCYGGSGRRDQRLCTASGLFRSLWNSGGRPDRDGSGGEPGDYQPSNLLSFCGCSF